MEVITVNQQSKLPNRESELYRALLSLNTIDECFAFMSDLCTTTELKSMEQRFEIARMLMGGKLYSDILETTGASSATISRVNRSVNFGNNTYEWLFKRLDEEKTSEE